MLTQSHTQTTILTITGIIILGMLVLALWGMGALSYSEAAPSTQAPRTTKHNNAETTQRHAEMIQSLDIFGQPELAKPQPTATIAKKTRLQLKLLGILNEQENSQGSVAIIADSTGRELAFQISDDLPGGASLETIFPDHVVLKYRGQLERLDLERKEVNLKSGAKQPEAAARIEAL